MAEGATKSNKGTIVVVAILFLLIIFGVAAYYWYKNKQNAKAALDTTNTVTTNQITGLSSLFSGGGGEGISQVLGAVIPFL